MAKRAKKLVEASSPEMPGGTTVVLNEVARPLLTFGSDSPIWSQSGCLVPVDDIWGALVRLVPPATSSDTDVQKVVDRLLGIGASAVKLMPAGPAQKTPIQEQRPEQQKAAGPRAVVLAMVEEVPTADRAALRELVEKTLAEVRL